MSQKPKATRKEIMDLKERKKPIKTLVNREMKDDEDAYSPPSPTTTTTTIIIIIIIIINGGIFIGSLC